MPSYQLFKRNRDWLQRVYKGYNGQIEKHLVVTLAMMVTGVLLGPHVQLFAIAMCVPCHIKLTSIVRRLERFVADERVEVQVFFEPFVQAMQLSLGNETAYLLMDCTQAGPKCRTLFIGLAYHGTALPLIWKTIKGKKGHVKGEFQRALLTELYPKFRYHGRVIVLGDAEFSNETVINWLESKKGWDFVFRFQSNYRLQTASDKPWLSAKELYEAQGMRPGQVEHWEKVGFTEAHQIPGLTMTVHWGAEAQEPLCLISSLPACEQPHHIYEMRFWVETLFGNQKARGFQLARTQMTTPAHIDRLILALVIGTCMALGLGTHLIVTRQTDQVDRADRRDLSLFQLGWRWLYRLLALNRLDDIEIVFRWDFELPPPGFQLTQ
jgi:hypothetical protein